MGNGHQENVGSFPTSLMLSVPDDDEERKLLLYMRELVPAGGRADSGRKTKVQSHLLDVLLTKATPLPTLVKIGVLVELPILLRSQN